MNDDVESGTVAVSAADRIGDIALPPHTRLILASENILDQWGTRTEDGDLITVQWGEPAPEGWYDPTFTRHSDNNLLAAELDMDLLGFRDLLNLAQALLERYPPDTIVCSHHPEADIGARTVAAIRDLVASVESPT